LKQTWEGKNGRKFRKKEVSCIAKFSNSQMFSTWVSLRVIFQPTPIYIKFMHLCFCSKWETNPLVSLSIGSILFVYAIHHMSNLVMPISHKVIGYWWTWGQLSYVDNVVKLFCNAPCCGFRYSLTSMKKWEIRYKRMWFFSHKTLWLMIVWGKLCGFMH
jgi:hypothetical protein